MKKVAKDPNEDRRVTIKVINQKTGEVEQEYNNIDFAVTIYHHGEKKQFTRPATDIETLVNGWGNAYIGHVKHVENFAPLLTAFMLSMRELFKAHEEAACRKLLDKNTLAGLIDGMIRERQSHPKSEMKKK